MRLIQSHDPGRYNLTEELFGDDQIPPYAILSHTWGQDSEEVTFADVTNNTGIEKLGYKKIRFCGDQAQRDGFRYFWIDTCCINKSNSTELQEAITSMYRWYQNAAVCYAYLSDVRHESELRQSRWFTRGWTLQELIAPAQVAFFAQDGRYLGDKKSLGPILSEITGIPLDVLRGRLMNDCTVTERLMWANARTTKREEDHVYSLFGIFDVNMPIMYGEGKKKALKRFHEEVSKQTCATEIERSENVVELVKLVKSVVQRLEERLPNHQDGLGSTLSLTESSTAENLSILQKGLHGINNTVDTVQESSTTTLLSLLRASFLRLLSLFAAPFSYFETSSSFIPESYAPYDMGPRMFCYSFFLIKKQPTFAIVVQDLFVARTQRHWIRIKLRNTIPSGTPQWEPVARYNPQKNRSKFGWHPLTHDMVSLLKDVVAKNPDINDDTEIAIGFENLVESEKSSHFESLSNIEKATDSPVYQKYPHAITLTRTPNFKIINKSRNFVDSLRHQHVRMVVDTSLVTAFLNGTLLVANVDNRWALYSPVITGESGFDHTVRSIETAVALRGNNRAVQLVSVVVDKDTKCLKGMIMDLPPKGPMFTVLDNHRRNGKPVPWPIREKWAKQITRGVAAYHERGVVIAGMRSYNPAICINDHDDAVILHRSGKGLHPVTYNQNGLIPPECRTDSFAEGDGEVGPEFDVFQLGSILWHLYRSQYQQPWRTFCTLAGCPNATTTSCSEHKNPIALPKADADVPDYLHRIIALCRKENPRDRPSAWELAHMFPSDDEISRNIAMLGDGEKKIEGGTRLIRLEDARALYGALIICDLCAGRCPNVYYRCLTCCRGHFDMCDECFATGKHCMDTAHLLARYSVNDVRDDRPITRIVYLSSVDKKGNRRKITA